MALEGCIGEVDFRTRMAIKRFAIWERLRNDEIDSDEFSAEIFQWWKERHSHRATHTTTKRGKYHKPSSPELKWCTGCQREKSRAMDFTVDRSRSDGLNNQCRDCQTRKWKELNCRNCDQCGTICVGSTCKRCYHLNRVVRESDAIVQQIPAMIHAERQRMLDSLPAAQRNAYLQAEKLRDLALSLP